MLKRLTSRGSRPSGGVYQSLGGKLAAIILTCAAYLLFLSNMQDMLGDLIALLVGVLFVLFMSIFIFVKIPGLKATLPSWGEGMLDRLLINDRDGEASLKRLLIAAAMLSIILIPILSYSINYNSVAVKRNRVVKITQINGINYDLVRQYSDKNIFIQIKDDAYVPNYTIQRGSRLDELNYRTEYFNSVDRSELFPKPEIAKRVNELLRDFIENR